MSSTTIVEFEALIAEAYQLDDEIETFKRDVLRPKEARLEDLEAKILAELEAQEKTSYKSNHGTVVRSNRYSVKTPKTPEEKKGFFGWLQTKGMDVYWSYVTVNSQSLNALYKTELEVAKEAGDLGFAIPGIGEPTATPILSRRKAR